MNTMNSYTIQAGAWFGLVMGMRMGLGSGSGSASGMGRGVRVRVSGRRTVQKSTSSCTSNSATVEGPNTQARTVPPTTSAEPTTMRLVILAFAEKKCAKTKLLTNWWASGLG